MTQKRSVLSILLVVLLVPILAACGGGGSTTSTAPSASASSSTGGGTSASPSAAEESEEPSASGSASGGASASASGSASARASASGSASASANASGAGEEETATAGAGEEETATAGADETATSGAGGAVENIVETDPAAVGEELAAAYNGEYKGTKVTMLGPFVDADQVKFDNAVKPFEDATGIDIAYEGTKEFESIITVRVDGGTPPDIADFPQPGLMANFAQQGKVQDASKIVNQEWLNQNYNQALIDIATVPGANGDIVGGVFHRAFPKSLVWYPKDDWEDAGYEIPQTWDEMTALMDDIVADGDTPWCIGIASGTATGWPATDWMEDILLRTTSLENYDKWTSGEIQFTDPTVKAAAQRMSDIWLNDKYVYGGRQQIVTTDFGDSVDPMFEDPAKCYMHKQGSFITSFFPEDAESGVDYDFFYLPPIDEQYGKPVLFSGDLMTAFTDRPEVKAVLQYFSTFDSVKGWAASGGALSPHNDADPSVYANEVDGRVAELLQSAESLRFDGSDLMPGAVGAGTFWKGMTDYISGSSDLDAALNTAQSGWANVNQ